MKAEEMNLTQEKNDTRYSESVSISCHACRDTAYIYKQSPTGSPLFSSLNIFKYFYEHFYVTLSYMTVWPYLLSLTE